MNSADLQERMFDFAVRCVRVSEAIPASRTGDVIAKQLLRAGTSVGANYRAACRARSPQEFIAKLGIVEEECDEVIYWLELITSLKLIGPSKLQNLSSESSEILAITVSSIKTARSNLLKQSKRDLRKNPQSTIKSSQLKK
jgi:four helix bundle protein